MASGPRTECWPTSLTLFFIGHNAFSINGNSIWMSLVRVNGRGRCVPRSRETKRLEQKGDLKPPSCASSNVNLATPFFFNDKGELAIEERAMFHFPTWPSDTAHSLIFLSPSQPPKSPVNGVTLESVVSLPFLKTSTQSRKTRSFPFKRRSHVSQMAGRDFNTFWVFFVPPVTGEFVTLTAARGGIVQLNGAAFVT